MKSDWYQGIEAFCKYWPHAPMLQQTYEAMQTQFDDENDACIDSAKCIVESAARLLIQVLDDVENPITTWPDSPIRNRNPTTQNFVTAAIRLLELSSGRHDAFNKVISRHYDLAQALAKYRDLAGPTSHGRKGFTDRLTAYHRKAAVLNADAIVSLLHEAYLEREPDPESTYELYHRFFETNEAIDKYCFFEGTENGDELSVTIAAPFGEKITLNFTPSELLFGLDKKAFKDAKTHSLSAKTSPEQTA